MDHCLGLRIVAALRAAGVSVEAHLDHFGEDAPDVEWLAEVGTRRWVVLTKDKGMRRRPIERHAVVAANLQVFTLSRGNMTGEEMERIFTSSLDRMGRFLKKHKAPFIAVVTKNGIKLLGALTGDDPGGPPKPE